jgi:hypothetical protein
MRKSNIYISLRPGCSSRGLRTGSRSAAGPLQLPGTIQDGPSAHGYFDGLKTPRIDELAFSRDPSLDQQMVNLALYTAKWIILTAIQSL